MRGFATIGLYQPKSSQNVGSVLRAAACYEALFIAVQGRRYQRACTDTGKAYKHIPLIHCEDLHNLIPFSSVPVAIEIVPNARSLIHYYHPPNAFYIFGPEDGSLPKSVLSWCRDVVSIPTRYCMNLAATVNVVLYDRLQKGVQ